MEKPLNPITNMLKPGTLLQQIRDQSRLALASGALHSLPTESTFIEDAGIPFSVRVLTGLKRKVKARKLQDRKPFNPFLPYEPQMFVADLSASHLCLLNKFNVVDHHILITTREFEHQESPLNLLDFNALWSCMREMDGLAFYNGDRLAGASQPHKHLQLIPCPLVSEGPPTPLDPLISKLELEGIGQIPAFGFRHGILKFQLTPGLPQDQAAGELYKSYQRLTATMGLAEGGSYNLLLTRNWMLLVPRREEHFQSISINSLGFAGSLLARTNQEREMILEAGPMGVLEQVTFVS